MPNTRFLIWIALALMLFYDYQAWMKDYPAAGPAAVGTAPSSSQSLGDSTPDTPTATAGTPAPVSPAGAPASAPPEASQPAATASPASGPEAAAPSAGAAMIHVTTDVLEVTINSKGGAIDQADLLKYPLHK